MQKKKWHWKKGAGRFNIDAQAAGDRREALAVEKGRALHRKDIYEDAKDASSPFHAEVFKDSPADAEEAWRLEVCGRILRSLEYTVVIIEVEERPPIEVSYPAVTFIRGLGYEATATVLADEQLRQQAVADILLQIRAYTRKLKLYQDPKLIALALEFEALLNKASAA